MSFRHRSIYGYFAAVAGLCAMLALAGCGGGGSSSAAGLGTTVGDGGLGTGGGTGGTGGGGIVDNGVPAAVTTGTKLISTVSSDLSTAVATDPSGNVFAVGHTWGGIGTFVNADTISPGYTSDAFLIKYTPAGAVAWTRQFGSIEGDYATGVATDRLGNVFVAGYTYGAFDNQAHPGGRAMFVAKYAADGTRLWTRIYGSGAEDEATAVVADSAGNVFVTGKTNWLQGGETLIPTGFSGTGWESNGDYNGFAVKYDATGAFQWASVIGSDFGDSLTAAAVDEAGSLFVTGYTSVDTNFFHVVLADNTVVQEYFSTTPAPYTVVAKLSSATGTLVWGTSYGEADPSVTKTDSLQHEHKLVYQSYMTGIGVDRQGEVYVGGYIIKNHEGSSSNAGDVYFKLSRFDPSGTLVWHTYAPGTMAGDQVRGLTVDRGGDVYMTGYVAGSFDGNGRVGGTDAILMQFDGTSGSKIRTLQIGTVTEDKAMGIASDGGGNIYVAGFTYGSFGGTVNAGGYDAFVLKFNQALVRQ